MHNKMIVATKDQINFREFLSQKYIIVSHHVRESNDERTLFRLELLDHVIRELLPRDVLAELLVSRDQSIDPLFFSQTEYTDPLASLLDNLILEAVQQSVARSIVVHIAQQPREVGLRNQFPDVLDGVVEIMIAHACQVNIERVHWLNHVFASVIR